MKKLTPYLLLIYANILFAQFPCSSGIAFNGTDDYISPDDTDAINLQDVTDRTIEFWFKTSDITTKQVIYEEGGGTHAFLIYLEGGRIYLGAYRSGAGTAANRRFFRSGVGDIEVNKWHHIALTLEEIASTSLELKWYLNGVEQDSQTGLQVNNHTGDINLGRTDGNLRYPSSLVSNWMASSVGGSTSETYNDTTISSSLTLNYQGNVSLFRIWNVARTISEIDTNKSLFLTSGTDLVAYSDQDRIYYQPDGATSISLTAFVAVNMQYTTIPNTDAINLQDTRDRTIEFRFRATDLTTRQVLYEEGGGVNSITAYIEDGRFYFGAYRSSADIAVNRRFFRSGEGAILFNQWHHVAITLEDTVTPDLTLKWYLDGVEQDSQDGLQIDHHSGSVNIGRSGGDIRFPDNLVTGWSPVSPTTDPQTFNSTTVTDGGSYNFLGDIDLFRIWNVARTQTEIDTNKNTLLTSETDLVLYQNGTQMNYQPNGGTSITESEDVIGLITWDGSDSNVWTFANNWVADTAPDATKKQKVAIPDGGIDPVLTAEVSVGFLTINAGVELVIQSGATLNIYYGLENNGIITVEDGGSFIYHNCNASITGTGTFNIEKDSPSYLSEKFFSYWSSPLIVSDSDPNTIFSSNPNISSSNIYYFNASVSDADWAVNASNFTPGVGYAVRYDTTGSYSTTFSGKINEAAISVPVYYNTNASGTDTDGDAWNAEGDNLIGNPYSSAIDWDVIIQDTDNSSFLEGTIYLWNQSAAHLEENDIDDYLQYNLTGGASNSTTSKISSGQGFFVRTITAGTFKFKPTHQIAGDNTIFYKNANKTTANAKKEGRSWFSLSNGTKYSSMLVGFIKKATISYDNLYDGPYNINNKILGLYTLTEEGKKVTIQGLPKLNGENHIINLGYVVDKVDNYTIRINEEYINANYNIYLEDVKNNAVIDLRRQKSYSFTSNIGEYEDRFKLHYTQSTLSTKENSLNFANHNIKVFVDQQNELQIQLENNLKNNKITNVEVYNLLGSKIVDFNSSSRRNLSNYTSGVYLVKVKLNNGLTQTKKIILH